MFAAATFLVCGFLFLGNVAKADADLILTVQSTATIIQSSALVPETNGLPSGGNATVDNAVAGLTPIPVTLENTSNTDYTNVRISPIGANSHLQLWAKDSLGNWYDTNITGWGPVGGFPVPAGFSTTTDVYAISDVANSYALTVNLIDAGNSTVIATSTGIITVNAPPTLTSATITSDGSPIGDLTGATLITNNSGSCGGSGAGFCHVLNASSVVVTNGPLSAQDYGFVLQASSTQQAALKSYFGAKEGWSSDMLTQIDSEINGTSSFFYLVSDGSGNYSLADGFQKALEADDQPLVIDDTYPPGVYTYTSVDAVGANPVTVTLTVKRTLTVTGITANDKVYDGTTEATLNTAGATLVGVSSEDDVSLNTSTAVSTFDTKDIGTGKTVTVSGLALGGDDAGNYSLTQPTATADITPVVLAIAADSKTKNYGDTDPVLTYAITSGSLVGGDTLAGALARDAGENPGTYAINQGALSAGSNYSITFITGTLTIRNSLPLTTAPNSDGSLSATMTGEVAASTNANGIDITVDIPAGTGITGPSSWNSTLTLPGVTTNYVAPTPDSGYTASAIEAIEIGAGDTPLSLSNPVKLTFVGQAGNYVGWSQAGVFHPITAVCDSASAPTLTDGADCKINNGSDLIVWTKHFTVFTTYTQSPILVPTLLGGGGGYIPTAAPVVPTATPVTTAPTGQVLGVSTFRFTQTLNIGSQGDEVTQLQNKLTTEGIYSGPITGYFGPLTQAAVKAFQAKYGISQTGTVGPLTRGQLNSLVATAQPSAGQVLGASTNAATQAQITVIKTQLTSLIQQVLTLLQAQLNQATGH